MGEHMKKPSVSKRRATLMATLAAFIACHPAMGVFGFATTMPAHMDKIEQLQAGTYSFGRAVSASLQTFFESMMLGSVAFLFTLPIALLFGLPSHAVLIKSGFWKKRHYALAGAFMGTVAYIQFIQRTQGGYGLSFSSSLHLLLGTFTGIIAAVVFRLLMGNKGNPDGRPATWHHALFEAANLPKDMPRKPVALLCLGSGPLLLLVSLLIGVMTTLAAYGSMLIFAGLDGARADWNLMTEPLKGLLHTRFLGVYAIRLAIGSLLFSGIYIALRRMNRTGWIAFALAGFIDGPIIFVLAGVVQPYLLYGSYVGYGSFQFLIQGIILSAFTYALTAIIFRALLGRIAAQAKGQNVSAPAS